MIEVTNKINIYEIGGTKVEGKSIEIVSHWNERNKVVIVVEGKKYTVVADDLIQAIKNSTNVNR